MLRHVASAPPSNQLAGDQDCPALRFPAYACLVQFGSTEQVPSAHTDGQRIASILPLAD
jgi:hypothetical protein